VVGDAEGDNVGTPVGKLMVGWVDGVDEVGCIEGE
jgi:hypothetical protein